MRMTWQFTSLTQTALLVMLLLTISSFADERAQTLSDPDGKPADMSKPVKVYILMGQSNMLEMGNVAADADGTLEHAVKDGATEYEVAGFFWWQGDKDRYDTGHSQKYEQNLVKLIKTLRKEFNAPVAKFVCATLGQTDRDKATGTEKDIIEAQLAVSDPSKHPKFKGSVATVYTHPLSKGGASNSHYNGNAETYMNVGDAMGKAIVELLQSAK